MLVWEVYDSLGTTIVTFAIVGTGL